MEHSALTLQQTSATIQGAPASHTAHASWRWPEARWRQAVDKVRAGRPLTPATWPEGAQVAVALSFDADQETSSLRDGNTETDALEQELKDWVVKKIGKFAIPDRIVFAGDLPKTRSGKIMRRLLRDIGEGRALGDTTTLADSGVVELIRERSGAATEEE